MRRAEQQRSGEGGMGGEYVQQERVQSEDPEYVEQILDTDLAPAIQRVLEYYYSDEMLLGNIAHEGKIEQKWLMKVNLLMARAMHPPQESVMKGDYRAFLADDPNENIPSLSKAQRMQISQLSKELGPLRLSRSEDMAQQEQFGQIMTVGEQERRDKSNSGILSTLFGG